MLADKYDVFLFDLDGVIYIGEEVQPYARETIQRLREMNKEIRYVTNNPCTTRVRTMEKLLNMHVSVKKEEVITAGTTVAKYLREKEYKNILLLGDVYLESELAEQGIKCVDDNPEAVVVGWSDEVTFKDIREAARWIREGTPFIATGKDNVFPLPEGLVPATGTIVAALKAATAAKPIITGKPFTPMFQTAIPDKFPKNKVLMIGDNLDTDIRGAHTYGIDAALIKHTFSEDLHVQRAFVPEYEFHSLEELFEKSD